eukprot:955589-Pelagomonas_calceolata.AAC.10
MSQCDQDGQKHTVFTQASQCDQDGQKHTVFTQTSQCDQDGQKHTMREAGRTQKRGKVAMRCSGCDATSLPASACTPIPMGPTRMLP